MLARLIGIFTFGKMQQFPWNRLVGILESFSAGVIHAVAVSRRS
jgi:hypothetical protein